MGLCSHQHLVYEETGVGNESVTLLEAFIPYGQGLTQCPVHSPKLSSNISSDG